MIQLQTTSKRNQTEWYSCITVCKIRYMLSGIRRNWLEKSEERVKDREISKIPWGLKVAEAYVVRIKDWKNILASPARMLHIWMPFLDLTSTRNSLFVCTCTYNLSLFFFLFFFLINISVSSSCTIKNGMLVILKFLELVDM